MTRTTGGPLQARILAYLKAHGPTNPNKLTDALNAQEGQKPTTRGSIRDALYQRMEARGLVRKLPVAFELVKGRIPKCIKPAGPLETRILEVLREAGKPLGAGAITEAVCALGSAYTLVTVRDALYRGLVAKGLVRKLPVAFELVKQVRGAGKKVGE